MDWKGADEDRSSLEAMQLSCWGGKEKKKKPSPKVTWWLKGWRTSIERRSPLGKSHTRRSKQQLPVLKANTQQVLFQEVRTGKSTSPFCNMPSICLCSGWGTGHLTQGIQKLYSNHIPGRHTYGCWQTLKKADNSQFFYIAMGCPKARYSAKSPIRLHSWESGIHGTAGKEVSPQRDRQVVLLRNASDSLS